MSLTRSHNTLDMYIYESLEQSAYRKKHVGNTTKIHTVVDRIGNHVYFQLSDGNINDNTQDIDGLSHVKPAGSNVLGDKAYGTVSI